MAPERGLLYPAPNLMSPWRGMRRKRGSVQSVRGLEGSLPAGPPQKARSTANAQRATAAVTPYQREKNRMDLTELLHRVAAKLPSLQEDDRAIVAPLIEHMHAGVIRPVTDDERSVLVRLGGGAQ